MVIFCHNPFFSTSASSFLRHHCLVVFFVLDSWCIFCISSWLSAFLPQFLHWHFRSCFLSQFSCCHSIFSFPLFTFCHHPSFVAIISSAFFAFSSWIIRCHHLLVTVLSLSCVCYHFLSFLLAGHVFLVVCLLPILEPFLSPYYFVSIFRRPIFTIFSFPLFLFAPFTSCSLITFSFSLVLHLLSTLQFLKFIYVVQFVVIS